VVPAGAQEQKDKVLPLPGWLKKAYFIFPIVLYIPDALFNYYVYSDGGTVHDANPLIQAGQAALWGFLAVGVVGMAYLLSVLAPWHWGQGHRIQAFFCGLGVLIATGITTWNSLAYRSQDFHAFATDKWAYSIWPELQANGVSITMILVAIAPPFWGLFWAIVQPTETGRTLGQIRESHQERLLRLQQEAELKQVRADANAKIRAAQLRGMAATAAAARDQAAGLLNRNKGEAQTGNAATTSDGQSTAADNVDENAAQTGDDTDNGDASKLIPYPTMPSFAPSREYANGRGGATLYNHAAASTPATHSAPMGQRAAMSQPSLIGDADVQGPRGIPSSDTMQPLTPRRPPMLGASFDSGDLDGMTGTTGPRPAVRRAAEPGGLIRGLNGPSAEHVRLVKQAMRELGISEGKRTLTATQARTLVPVVAERLNVDESSAKSLIGRVMKSEAQRAAHNQD
jgi:hypothetical protein